MNVKDILQQVSIRLTGIPVPSDEEEKFFLSCLNSAHFEIWDIVTDFYNTKYCRLNNVGVTFKQELNYGVELTGVKKIFFVFKEKYGDLEGKPYEFLLTDPGFTQRAEPKNYILSRNPKSCTLFLRPLPTLPSHQVLWYGFAEHPTELALGDQEAQIPYDPVTVQGLLIGACLKAFESNLGTAVNAEYNNYAVKWQEFKSNLRSETYAQSPKTYGRIFSYV